MTQLKMYELTIKRADGSTYKELTHAASLKDAIYGFSYMNSDSNVISVMEVG